MANFEVLSQIYEEELTDVIATGAACCCAMAMVIGAAVAMRWLPELQ